MRRGRTRREDASADGGQVELLAELELAPLEGVELTDALHGDVGVHPRGGVPGDGPQAVPGHLRVTAGTQEETTAFLDALGEVLRDDPDAVVRG